MKFYLGLANVNELEFKCLLNVSNMQENTLFVLKQKYFIQNAAAMPPVILVYKFYIRFHF